MFVRLTCRIAPPFVAIAGTRQFGRPRSVGNCLRPEGFLPVNYLLLHKSLLPRAGLEFTHPESNCSRIHRSRTARPIYTERPIRKPISIRRENEESSRLEHTPENYSDYLGVCTVHQKKKKTKRPPARHYRCNADRGRCKFDVRYIDICLEHCHRGEEFTDNIMSCHLFDPWFLLFFFFFFFFLRHGYLVFVAPCICMHDSHP